MEIAQLVLEYLKVILWPGIVVTAILLFRKQLQELLANVGKAVNRLKKFTAPGTLFELVEELSQSTDQVTRPRGLGPGTGTLISEPDTVSLDDLTTGKIVHIWAEIERSIEQLANYHLDKERIVRPNLASMAKELTEANIIPPSFAATLRDARVIKGHMTHGLDTIPVGTVDDYIRTISKLRAYLQDAVGSVPGLVATLPKNA